MYKTAIYFFFKWVFWDNKQPEQCSICWTFIYLFIFFVFMLQHYQSYTDVLLFSYEYKQIKRKKKFMVYAYTHTPNCIIHMGNVLFPGCVNSSEKQSYSFLEILFCWQRSHKSCLLICFYFFYKHFFELALQSIYIYIYYTLILFNLGITNCLY